MSLFLVPASEANISTSMDPPLSTEVVERLLSRDQVAELRRAGADRNGYRCWAMTKGKKATWERMRTGDVVLFSVKGSGEFGYAGEVACTLKSRSFGNSVWPFQPGNPWEFVYFLKSVRRIALPKRDLVMRLGYNPNFQVQGATYVKPDRLAPILSRHSSVEKWLAELQSGREPPPPVQRAPESGSTSDEEGLDAPAESAAATPFWLVRILDDVLVLRKDARHQERGHETIVEAFYEALGYRRFTEIRHRQGRIDISIVVGDEPVVVNEVKRDWNLSWRSSHSAVDQVYRYASHVGARFAVVTNGDYYALFDRKKGLSIDENFAGEFRLTELTTSGLDLVESLSRTRLLDEL